MVYGLLLGLPWLAWTMLLLWTFVYVVAVMFRFSIAPTSGESLVAKCGGKGDEIPDGSGQCQAHYLYGEEYFGTISASMFTVFRCMLQDCTTKAGRSLTMELSDGFGLSFDLMYTFGMVFLIFGIFNVVSVASIDKQIFEIDGTFKEGRDG